MGKAFLHGNGGGGTGGTLVVTAPVGVTVTATNEAIGKTYRRTANSSGIATFKGLATGVWSLSISDGETTSTPVSVDVNADYEITLAFFAAEIVVTYPANSTCTCSDGTTTFTDTNSTDAEKTVMFTVPNKGTWTIIATANDGSDDRAEEKVEINDEGQYVTKELTYMLYIVKDGEIKTLVSYNGMRGTTADGILTIQQSVNVRDAPLFANFGPVDVTIYAKMYVELAGSYCNTQYTNTVGIATSKNSTSPVAKSSISANDKKTKTIDVSKYSDPHYVIFQIESRSEKAYVNVKNLWLVKAEVTA